jgi:hypothetical protein
MADIVTFVPRAELDAQANMEGFIDLCKTKLTIFGLALVFAEDTWDVSETIQLKGKHNAVRLVFSNLETSDEQARVMMREPFKSFAKSYMRYQHGMNPVKNVSQRLTALRALEAALAEFGTSDPVQVTAQVLNRAAQMLQDRIPGSAYFVALKLAAIADFLSDNALLAVPTSWRSSLKKPAEKAGRVGKEFDERRAQKMPTQAALDALPKVFLLATEPADVLVSSVTAILVSAPDRINELLLLPADCETRKKRKGSEEDAYALRWWPAKGAEPMLKWIIPSMSSVVAEAVARIRRITDEARTVARWYEQNPGKLYLTEASSHLRNQEWLSMPEVTDIVFADPVHRTAARQWCEESGVPREKRGTRIYARFADVEAAVLKELPRGFPVLNDAAGLKYGEALCVMQRYTLDSSRARMRCIIEPIGHPHIHNRLGARSESGIQSIFDRCGLTEPDGSPIRTPSHSFRHYLNTLAQVGGLSQLDIAKWSGRKDVRQNEAYDHESTESLLARVRKAIGDDERMFGPLSTAPRAALIPRDEFARLKVPTAHTTDFGYCIHDYVMSPCQMHRDCLNCGEQVCIKGQPEKEKRIRQAHAESTRLLALAEQAEADGDYGASDWVAHHRQQLARVTALLEIIDNPVVPPGAIIQLMPADIGSRLDHARSPSDIDRPRRRSILAIHADH